jgi:TPR repeat protein
MISTLVIVALPKPAIRKIRNRHSSPASGSCVKQDDVTALHWYERAVQQGFAPAVTNAALFYSEGRHGLTIDAEHALQLHCRAAEAGFAPPQLRIGEMYPRGEGLPRDPKLAFHSLDSAAEQGLPMPKTLLGSRIRWGAAYARTWWWRSTDSARPLEAGQLMLPRTWVRRC